jgi:hypothetical protein
MVKPRTVALVAFWFTCNVGVLLLNKVLLSTFEFEFPVALTALHVRVDPLRRRPTSSPLTSPRHPQMCTCVLVTQLALSPPFRLVPREPLRSGKKRRSVVLLSVVFSLSVVAGNVSLQYIPVSFNQAVSSTDPAFTAVFALVLQGKKETALTYAALFPVVAGTALASGVRPYCMPCSYIAEWLIRIQSLRSLSPCTMAWDSPCVWLLPRPGRSRA